MSNSLKSLTECIRIERFDWHKQLQRVARAAVSGGRRGEEEREGEGSVSWYCKFTDHCEHSLACTHPPQSGEILAAMCSKQRLVPCTSLAKPPSSILSCRAISRYPIVCVQDGRGCR